ncbi:MAG: 23S rRNA (adenine(2030)-N(6))-methyltransferase RlmJ [Legionellales bacterium]|nr:23S rRNA (adenine(2030)-N(6))-methyltransferase RlmJ [Legionellales bacterium]
MLSYQHIYHAGCFADVIKHLGLCNILSYMVQKEKPIFYLDTHAGRGLYDLHAKEAMKNQEFLSGITALWSERTKLPPEFSDYLAALEQWNPNGHLQYYPGSPALAMQLLRSQDRLFLCERHPGEFEHLQQVTRGHARVHCAIEDGYHALQSRLPPPERRGMIMLDPSYEIKNEYRTVAEKVQAALRHFGSGVFCIWYPIIDKKLHAQLIQGFAATPNIPALRAEFHLNSKPSVGMDACGLYIYNPPFLLEQALRSIFDRLLKVFNPGRSSYVLQSIG